MTDTETRGPTRAATRDDSSRVRSAAHGAAEQASALAGTGRDEAARVADEVRTQSTRLVSETRSTARERVGSEFGQFATTLHDLSGELDQMGQSARPDGPLAALAHDGATALRQVSRRIDEDGLDGTLDDVRAFARRRPLVFLGGAFAVGIVAGRLMRNADLGAIASEAGEPTGGDGRLREEMR